MSNTFKQAEKILEYLWQSKYVTDEGDISDVKIGIEKILSQTIQTEPIEYLVENLSGDYKRFKSVEKAEGYADRFKKYNNDIKVIPLFSHPPQEQEVVELLKKELDQLYKTGLQIDVQGDSNQKLINVHRIEYIKELLSKAGK